MSFGSGATTSNAFLKPNARTWRLNGEPPQHEVMYLLARVAVATLDVSVHYEGHQRHLVWVRGGVMTKHIDRDEVRRASRLEEVIQSLTGQQLRGANGRAEPVIVCPWHEDAHPSLR